MIQIEIDAFRVDPDFMRNLTHENMVKGMRAVTLDAVGLVQGTMRESIAAGEVYGNHRASAPGQPPAIDTGRLVAAIVAGPVAVDATGVEGRVSANTEYAAALQMGTDKMAARPFLDVAINTNKDRLAAVFAAAAKL